MIKWNKVLDRFMPNWNLSMIVVTYTFYRNGMFLKKLVKLNNLNYLLCLKSTLLHPNVPNYHPYPGPNPKISPPYCKLILGLVWRWPPVGAAGQHEANSQVVVTSRNSRSAWSLGSFSQAELGRILRDSWLGRKYSACLQAGQTWAILAKLQN